MIHHYRHFGGINQLDIKQHTQSREGIITSRRDGTLREQTDAASCQGGICFRCQPLPKAAYNLSANRGHRRSSRQIRISEEWIGNRVLIPKAYIWRFMLLLISFDI
jgi:hypothetical protein